MRFLFLAAVPLALAGCDVQTKDPTGAGEAVEVKGDEQGRIAFNMPFGQGEVKLPAGMMKNSNFDIDGVKMIPGGTITGFDMKAPGGDAAPTVNMTFTAPIAPEEVRSYFVEQFRAKGVTASLSGDALTGQTNDGTGFVMRFAPQGTGTAGTIRLDPKP